MSFRRHQQDWEDLAELDPLWSILTIHGRKFNNWDVEEFFLTGEREIQTAINHSKQLGHPLEFKSALDFGCGVGRLTRYLGMHFQECYGVDISERMIEKAKELNKSYPNCRFILNSEKLDMFPDNKFDMVYTSIVLQHIPEKNMIKSYIYEFIRVLKENGLLIFQLPHYIPLRYRFQPIRRAYSLLNKLGIDKNFLYNNLLLSPMRMTCIQEKEIGVFLNKIGGKVLESTPDNRAGASIHSRTYFVTK